MKLVYNPWILVNSMKYLIILGLVIFFFFFLIEGRIIAQEEAGLLSLENKAEEEKCNAIKNNLQFRASYYNVNTDLIISDYSNLYSSLLKARDIYDELDFSTVELNRHIQRLERFIEDTRINKEDLVSSLGSASEHVCEDERAMRRDIIDAKGYLKDLKQEISDLNSFLLLKVSPTIQDFN